MLANLPTALVTSLVLLSSTASAAFDCKLSLGSDKFDLTPLKELHTIEKTALTPPTVTKVSYAISLCDAIPSSSPDPDVTCPAGTSICITTTSVTEGYEDRVLSAVPVAGEIGSGALNPTASFREGEKLAEKGWLLSLEGGMYKDVKQRAVIEMVCEAGAEHTAPTLVSYDDKTGLLSLKWVSIAACSTTASKPPGAPDDKDKTPPGGDDGKKPPVSEGKGFFGWFFTLFFFSMLAYFVGGMWYNYSQYGATGWDMVPHRDVWRDFPYVVADLFKGRGSSRNGYSALG